MKHELETISQISEAKRIIAFITILFLQIIALPTTIAVLTVIVIELIDRHIPNRASQLIITATGCGSLILLLPSILAFRRRHNGVIATAIIQIAAFAISIAMYLALIFSFSCIYHKDCP